MLAIGRAFDCRARPRLLLLDEPSTRPGPLVVHTSLKQLTKLEVKEPQSCWSNRMHMLPSAILTALTCWKQVAL